MHDQSTVIVLFVPKNNTSLRRGTAFVHVQVAAPSQATNDSKWYSSSHLPQMHDVVTNFAQSE
jgi:hypothetical protein